MNFKKNFAAAVGLSMALAGAAAAQPTLITGIESDADNPPFPPANDGDWAGFGAALADIGIETNGADVDAGSQSLAVSANWASWGMGIAYNVAGASIDISSGPVMSYRAKQDATNSNTVVIRIEETDGDIWLSAPTSLTTSFETYYADMSSATADGGSSGDGTLDLTSIAYVGFVLFTNGATGTNVMHFDEIYYGDSIPTATPPALPIVTSMEPPDQTSAGFPPAAPPTGGTEGEWTRFGAAYNGIFLLNNPTEATEGDYILQVSANWPAGTRVGARHKPYNAPADWSSENQFEYDVKADAVVTGTTQQFAMFETDGDVWVASTNPVSDTWGTQTIPFSSLTLEASSTGDGAMDLDAIELWGLNFDNPDFPSTTQDFFVDYARVSTASSIADWTIFE